MGYHVIDPEAVEPTPDRPCERRPVGDVAGLENLAVNRYVAAPGEQLPLAYHYHDDQEEVFYVDSGTLHVETPGREYAVEAGSFFVVEPESPQRAFVPSSADESAAVVAIGAPRVDDVHAYEPDDT